MLCCLAEHEAQREGEQVEEEKIQRSNHLWESGMVEKAKIFRGREEETVSMHLQSSIHKPGGSHGLLRPDFFSGWKKKKSIGHFQ